MSDDKERTEPRRRAKSKEGITPPVGQKGQSQPAITMTAVLPRKVVVVLAIICLIAATLLCLVGVFWPTVVASQTARYFLCLVIASLFSVFYFPFFPADYKLKLNKIGIPIVLVGPVALWLAVFFSMWKVLPIEDNATQLFVPASVNDQLPYSNTWILSWDPVQPVYHKVRVSDDQNNNDPTLAVGFYVQFDKAHDKYIARVGIGPSSEEIRARYELILNRGSSTYQARALPNGGVEKR